MAKQPLLVLIGRRYYFRRRIPLDLSRLVNNNLPRWKHLTGPAGPRVEDWKLLIDSKGRIKETVKISLGTSDRRKAAEALHMRAAEVSSLFSEVQQVFEAAQTADRQEPSDTAIMQIAHLWAYRKMRTLSDIPIQPGTEDQQEWLDIIQGDLVAASDNEDPTIQRHYVKTTHAVLDELGYSLKPTSTKFEKLCRLIREAEIEALQRKEMRLFGKSSQQFANPVFRAVNADTPPPMALTKPSTSLGQLIDAFMNDPGREHRSDKTKVAYQTKLAVVRELIGDNKPVGAITRQDCQDVLNALGKLPPNATKLFPGKGTREVVKLVQDKNLPTLHPKTLKSYLVHMKAFFNWAVENEHMEKNPAQRIKVDMPKWTEEEKWEPFTINQLNKIFSAPLYIGCQDDNCGYSRPGPNIFRRGRYWVPLLALFHGLRANEACQLLVGDITKTEGIPIIHVRVEKEAGGKKKVKSKAGMRKIPIHPDVINMGFLKYVEQMKNANEERLFPELTRGRTGYYSDPFSKWFGRFLNSLEAKTKFTSFHSFRHCFRDAMREADIPQEAALKLGGWSESGVHAAYGKGLSLTKLREEIAKIKYPGVNLGHLI